MIPSTEFKSPRYQCARCDDIIYSRFSGEFVSCKCGEISVDATRYYVRCIGDYKLFKLLPDDNNSSNDK